jgi:hypothetical protein
MMTQINKESIKQFFERWLADSIKELDGKKLIFPDDWPEDFADKSADYFCSYFGVEGDE